MLTGGARPRPSFERPARTWSRLKKRGLDDQQNSTMMKQIMETDLVFSRLHSSDAVVLPEPTMLRFFEQTTKVGGQKLVD